MSWVYLGIAGILEVGFTTCMRYTEGFRNIPWTLAFLVCLASSMVLLEQATRNIPIGTAYAIWTGIGAVGTVLVGIAFHGEPGNPVRVALILGLVGCVAGLKFTSGH